MTAQTPQQAALQRLTTLRDKVTRSHVRITELLKMAMNDAVRHGIVATTTPPEILSDNGLTELNILKNELSELQSFYEAQLKQLTDVVNAAAAAAPEATAPTSENTVDPEALRRELEERTQRMALERARQEETQQVKAIHPDTVEPASASLPVVEEPVAAPELPQAAAPELPTLIAPPENSITRLLGKNSPLLDIFAPGPWLPEGRGTVTVGSDGFQWYKDTDPLNRDPAARATLPNGFYGGKDYPRYAVLRMKTCILIWSFELAADAMHLFMVGVTDTDKANLRWIKPTELSASFTRKLIQELAEVKERLVQARQ